MKIAVFSAKRYDRDSLDAANVAAGHELQYFEAALGHESAGHDAVCNHRSIPGARRAARLN